MSNVIGISGKVPTERKISDMSRGEVGYTMEWAYDKDTDTLDENYPVHVKGGTASLRVECVMPGKYSLTFEEPVYRQL